MHHKWKNSVDALWKQKSQKEAMRQRSTTSERRTARVLGVSCVRRNGCAAVLIIAVRLHFDLQTHQLREVCRLLYPRDRSRLVCDTLLFLCELLIIQARLVFHVFVWKNNNGHASWADGVGTGIKRSDCGLISGVFVLPRVYLKLNKP